jgi:hypothetical protein
MLISGFPGKPDILVDGLQMMYVYFFLQFFKIKSAVGTAIKQVKINRLFGAFKIFQ